MTGRIDSCLRSPNRALPQTDENSIDRSSCTKTYLSPRLGIALESDGEFGRDDPGLAACTQQETRKALLDRKEKRQQTLAQCPSTLPVYKVHADDTGRH
ncbi:MAG TPA: hypothetical protein DDY14_04370 [Chromatiaceae bacterium]|jgi:hypothetical protein|nr:MAG: hypothetical protein N838_15395 [Thiohalocapsa sp. PB-PSB1]HBG94562.1 hypothetical protein [Chromatiaceae bacterium]HCS90837.1 hypothetical protein [Chromatiaceae bacterium]